MTRFLLSQYAIKKNKNPNSNNQDKTVDKSKKDDGTKPEDKDDNTAGTTGAHVEETTSVKDKTVAPSNSSSIGAQVSDVTKTVVLLSRYVQDILASHPFENPIQNLTNPVKSWLIL